MTTTHWEAALLKHLTEAGVEPAEARELASDAIAEAEAAGLNPDSMYGPALAYANTLAQTVRRATATAAPLPRERGAVVLHLRGVSKSYRRRKVLREVNLDLRAGEVTAIVGANGSGKSTLLNICAGLTRASSGTVERTPRIGYAPQHDGVSALLTPEEHFKLFGSIYRMSPRRSVSSGSYLAGQLGWRPRKDVIASHLSGGTQQKLNVILSSLNRPDLILLDEPYQGFDQDSYVDFWDQVFRWRDGGAGVLAVTHMLHDLDRVDRVLELRPVEES